MLAVVEIGKKQYVVEKGDLLDVQKLEAEKGKITFDKVLVFADSKTIKVGTPYVSKAHVEAEIEGLKKGKKVIVYKAKRRKKYRKKQGHRQTYTTLKITLIVGSSPKLPSK